MSYSPELYCLQDQSDFPFQKAVRVTAATVSRWCSYYYAELIAPESKHIRPMKKSGTLPEDVQARQAFIADTVDWLIENSVTRDLFCLFLDSSSVPLKDRAAKFDHHDDTCCWGLDLSESEFAELQAAWRANYLPEDLFYPQEAGIAVEITAPGLKGKILRALGATQGYTPKRWEQEQNKHTR